MGAFVRPGQFGPEGSLAATLRQPVCQAVHPSARPSFSAEIGGFSSRVRLTKRSRFTPKQALGANVSRGYVQGHTPP